MASFGREGRVIGLRLSPKNLANQLQEQTQPSPALIWGLALPILGESVLDMAVTWSDQVITGRFFRGADHLAAITVSGYLIWFTQACAALVGMGALAVVARLLGAQQRFRANRIVMQAIILAVLWGTVVAAGLWILSPVVVLFLLPTEASRHLAVEYLRIVSLGVPFLMVLRVGSTCLRAGGHTQAGFVVMTITNLINIAVSWTLTVGLGPIPALGWAGVAWGTSTGFAVGGITVFCWLYRGHQGLRIPRRWPVPEWSSMGRILRVGVPGASGAVMTVVGQLWYVSIVGRLGDVSLAAHGLAIHIESLGWRSADALSRAASALVGQSLGAKRVDLAMGYSWMVLRWGLLVTGLMGALFFLFPDLLLEMFVPASKSQVIVLGSQVLRLVAFAMPALATSLILTGILRGAGDTRWPFVYGTLSMLAVRVPLAYALTGGVVSWGLWGAWVAMWVDLHLQALAALARFWHQGWTKTEV